jgi:cellulose synthase/poly-beta-1,6-N-acetylglucosamine synthase-like glycosyltransferase
MNFLIFLYMATLVLCLTSYFFYPVTILLYGKIAPIRIKKREITPTISILISAYNEEQDIKNKLENTFSLDYPKEKMEILVGSDGSQDNTAKIVRQFLGKGVSFFDYQVNRGKTAVQNDLVKQSTGEILVFTDAASFLPPHSLKVLVANFADPRIGCVAGMLRFTGTEENLTTESQGIYWRYESKLRRIESRIGGLIGVDGPLYAVRRDKYVPLAPNIISDLITPLLVLGQGSNVVLEPEAVVDEVPTIRTQQEFNTRRRITLRGLIGLTACSGLLNPLKHPFLSCQILFHKIIRWLVGPLVALNVIACLLLLPVPPFKQILIMYCLFFFSAYAGWLLERKGRKIKILTIPYYFCLINAAATMGILDFLRRKDATSWSPVRH